MAVPALLFASVFLGSKVLAEPPAKTPPQGARPFHSSFFGEGGSYHEPDSGAKEYLEQGPKPDPAAKRETPAAPKKTPDAFLKRDPASLRYQKGAESAREDGLPKVELPAYQAPSSSDDRRRYSLWEGIAAPLALPPEKIKDVAPDQASSLIRQDYDSHILGGPAAQAIGLSAPTRAQAAAASPETFVAIDLDLKGKELKDAVAGLSGAAGFRQDPRFEPVFSGPAREKAAVYGWLALSRLGDAMKVPAVARLQTDGRAAPFAHQGLTSRILVGIRVRAGQSVGETLKAVVADLEARAHFRLERAVGYQEVPETKDLAVVAVGEVPILELSRVMAHPDVLKVLPAPGRDSESSVPRQPSKRVGDLKPGAEPARFIFFVERRAPLLIVATLMLLLLPIGGRALRWLNVFSPYRR